jgi:hypothetical protein
MSLEVCQHAYCGQCNSHPKHNATLIMPKGKRKRPSQTEELLGVVCDVSHALKGSALIPQAHVLQQGASGACGGEQSHTESQTSRKAVRYAPDLALLSANLRLAELCQHANIGEEQCYGAWKQLAHCVFQKNHCGVGLNFYRHVLYLCCTCVGVLL